MSPSGPATASLTQKRARQQLSCTACRTGKLKCDRQQPCDQCIKRCKDSSCQYLAPPPKKKQKQNTKERIAHLEGLVVQLMNKDGSVSSDASPMATGSVDASFNEETTTAVHAGPSPQSSQSQSTGSETLAISNETGLGRLKISHGRTKYKGASHWESILDSIAGVKAAVDDDADSEDSEEEDEGITSPYTFGLLGGSAAITKSDILQRVPARPAADRLLWHWFNSTDPALPLIHRPTFLIEYENFWQEPEETPTMWLALFFSMLCLGYRISRILFQDDQSVPQSAHIDSAEGFQQLAASALQLAGFVKPKKYTIEAMIMYADCEYMKKEGDSIKVWYLMSLVARLALRMGYHRDPENFPQISPYDGEMRRRVWSVVYIFEVLLSYSLGLPNMLQHLQCDTITPRNLLDTDFGPQCSELPPARPPAELSSVSYSITKYKMTSVFARACNMAHSIHVPDYEKVMELDRFVRKTALEQPEALRFVSRRSDVLDDPTLIFHRYKGELTLHKTLCVLHRPFLSAKFVGTRMELSRKLCVEAALSMIKLHDYVFEAVQDGGQLSPARIYLDHLSAHDFLLAAMVLCVELDLISSAASSAMAGPNQDRISEIRELIEISYKIYNQPVNHHAQTSKAMKAMEIILKKSTDASVLSEHDQDRPNFETTSTGLAMQQPLPTITSINPSLSYLDATSRDQIIENTNYDAFLNPGQGLDWQTWDNIVQNTDDMANVSWLPKISTEFLFLDDILDETMESVATTDAMGMNTPLPPTMDAGPITFSPSS